MIFPTLVRNPRSDPARLEYQPRFSPGGHLFPQLIDWTGEGVIDHCSNAFALAQLSYSLNVSDHKECFARDTGCVSLCSLSHKEAQKAYLWNNAFRNQPRVDLDRQPSCLNCRIRRRQFLCFLKGGDVEDKYAAQISVTTKRSSHLVFPGPTQLTKRP